MNFGKKPEKWGGIECTINRVGNNYFDQLAKNGHFGRPDDLEKIAELGIRKLRYPILWEYTAPDSPQEIDYKKIPEFINKIFSLGIEPIAGLLHHGSGPSYTDLLDPDFPMLFSDYAYETAKKFPEIKYYTPINEPLTTARFSCLYGHWYPHKTDDRSFCKALINQCKATVMAMKRIREINPEAELIQTEDMGFTKSTPELKYQADFDNNRRWLSFDLLCGKVSESHEMLDYFSNSGISKKDLNFFTNDPCPPAIIGINYYVTSERFLDHEIYKYPENVVGGNGSDDYADIEIVRTNISMKGLSAILTEASERYGIPIAITEAHLACNVDEQIKWLAEVWNTVCTLQESGIGIEAVTFWSLLGTYNWCNLCTIDEEIYERGIFDCRDGNLKETKLVTFVKDLHNGKKILNPMTEGWWKEDKRIQYFVSDESSCILADQEYF